MRIEGRRIQIAGSASAANSEEQLRYAHSLVRAVVTNLGERGARFLVGVGKEPRVGEGDTTSPSQIFDWTVLAAVHSMVHEQGRASNGKFGRLVTTLATAKTEAQVPDDRRHIWDWLKGSDALELEFLAPGWTSGAVRRERQARLGDVLIVLSGGEGVEHLAQLYARAGKPVVAFDLNLGSSTSDGSGGAARLATRALANPSHYFRLTDPHAAGALLADLATVQGTRPIADVTDALMRLLDAIADPTAFYVRLLNPTLPEFQAVERYFRYVVDPVVQGFGYNPVEMGRNPTTEAWMNQAIFEQLHHCQLVIADLTAVRASCFMELGYALRGDLPVLITALMQTAVPFDAQMLEYCSWDENMDDNQRQHQLREYWRRNISRPQLVRPREVL